MSEGNKSTTPSDLPRPPSIPEEGVSRAKRRVQIILFIYLWDLFYFISVCLLMYVCTYRARAHELLIRLV